MSFLVGGSSRCGIHKSFLDDEKQYDGEICGCELVLDDYDILDFIGLRLPAGCYASTNISVSFFVRMVGDEPVLLCFFILC